jgi:signal transduction histidine kinase
MRASPAPLRAQERVVAAALAALVGIACAALVILTALSRSYSRRVTTLNDGLRAVDNIRIDMSALGRQSALAYATKDPKHETTRSHTEADLLRRIDEAKNAIRDPQQNALLQKAGREVSDFIEVRRRLEAKGVPPDELMLVSLPRNQQALNTLYSVSRLGFVAESSAEAKLARWELVETVLGVSIAILVMGGFLGVAMVVRRRILAPLLALGEGIDQFASGDRSARVVPTGSPELQRTASSFNDMAGRLERQTRDLLTFLAGVAHDLRNPLTSMRMGVQLLAPGRPPVPEDKRQKTVEVVERQVTRLERMVGDFLDATRIESGNLRLELAPADLRAPAQEAVDLYSASSPAHRLLFFAPERPVEVVCDVERVAQVLNNLVSNAIKYSPRGGDVVVSLEERGDQAIVSVRDSGIGIAPSEKDLVFEPFRRTGSSRETAPGVGLGLSVARRIVEAHHGVIDFESRPGAGSTFRVRLPLAGASDGQRPRFG